MIDSVEKLENFGQAKLHDVLYMHTRYGTYVGEVKEVIFEGTSREEILLNKPKNHYFLISKYIKGDSWVSCAYILKNTKLYKRGRGIKNL
jgi:hypothetical protein